MRFLVTLFTVAVLAVPAAAQPSAGKVPRVGVIVDVTVNVSPSVADSMSSSLAKALAKKLKVDAIGGTDVTRRLPEGGLPDECISTPACVADLGKRLGADQLLFMAVVRIGTDYQIDVTFVDIASGRQAARNRVQVKGDPKAAAEVFTQEAERYLPDVELRAGGPNTLIINKGDAARRPIKPVVWAFAGVGAGLLVGGGILGLTARSSFRSCEPDRCDQGRIDSIHTRLVVADVAMGIGVAAGVTAVVFYLRTPREKPVVEPTVTPTPGGAVLSLGGRF